MISDCEAIIYTSQPKDDKKLIKMRNFYLNKWNLKTNIVIKTCK